MQLYARVCVCEILMEEAKVAAYNSDGTRQLRKNELGFLFKSFLMPHIFKYFISILNCFKKL